MVISLFLSSPSADLLHIVLCLILDKLFQINADSICFVFQLLILVQLLLVIDTQF